MEWIEKNAIELYECSSGLSKAADQFGFGYPFLSYSDIFHNYYVPEKLLTLVNSTEKERKSCSVKRGDVFLTRTSETTDELGMSCVALQDYPNATFNGFAKRLRPITNEIVPEYASYFFRSSYFRAQCMSLASLITRASLNEGMIGRLKIRYPKSKDAQAKIGSILKNYGNLIENNNKRIKILEQMAENLYKEWFVRFRFPGHETAPLENGIPKGWSEEKLSAVFEVKYGKDHKNIEDGLIPIFGSGGIMRYGNKALCSEESVLIPRKGSLNNVMYYKGDFWTVDTMFYTKMKIKHCAKYTYFTLSKVDLVGLNSGASIPSMTTDILYHLKMIVPDESTLIAFDKQIDLLFAEKDRLELQNQNLIKQRDLLLPRLMSGKLAV